MAFNNTPILDLPARKETAVMARGKWKHQFMCPLFLVGLLFFLFAAPRLVAGAQLALNSGQAEKGEQVTFTLAVNNAPNALNAFMLDIEYDVNVLKFSSFAAGELARDGYSLFQVFNRTPGVVRVGGVEPEHPGVERGESGALVHLTFNVIKDSSCTLALTSLTNDVESWTTQAGRFEASGAEPSPDPAEEGAEAEEGTAAASGATEDSIMGMSKIASLLGEASSFMADGFGFGETAPPIDKNTEGAVSPEAAYEQPGYNAQGAFPQADGASMFGVAANRRLPNHTLDARTDGRSATSGMSLFVPEQADGAGQARQSALPQAGKNLVQNHLNGFDPRLAGKSGSPFFNGQVAPPGERLFEKAARTVEILLQAAILVVLLLVLKEMKSQRVKIKVFPGSASRPEEGVPEMPGNTAAVNDCRQSTLEKMRLIA